MPRVPNDRPPRDPVQTSRGTVRFEVSVDGVVPTNESLRRRHPDLLNLIPGAADGDRASFDTPAQAQEFATKLANSTPVDDVYPRPAPQPEPEDMVTVEMTEFLARATGYKLTGPILNSVDGLPTYTIETS